MKQFPDDAIYIDLFGGSGLLSHVAKREKPNATVIYNDFDNYRQRLDNIGRTNTLLAELREMVKDFTRKEKLPPEIRSKSYDAWKRKKRTDSWIILPFPRP